jgi:hypothetical protein
VTDTGRLTEGVVSYSVVRRLLLYLIRQYRSRILLVGAKNLDHTRSIKRQLHNCSRKEKDRMGVKAPGNEQSPRASLTRQYPTGNLIWVNTERLIASLEPLCRNASLDQMAREHAEEMTEAGELMRCTHETADIKENVLVGPSIQNAHKLAMSIDCEAKDNILNPDFKEFGMGAVKGKDKNLYVCQLFC